MVRTVNHKIVNISILIIQNKIIIGILKMIMIKVKMKGKEDIKEGLILELDKVMSQSLLMIKVLKAIIRMIIFCPYLTTTMNSENHKFSLD